MKSPMEQTGTLDRSVSIPVGAARLEGELLVPEEAQGLVVFVHGSGSSRHSPRNQFVARVIRAAGVGTLLFDLLTSAEELEDNRTRALRFDIGFLARRLMSVTDWVKKQRTLAHLRIGYFGSSTGGAAALVAAAQLGNDIGAVVSRGGRPDLAERFLAQVLSPTLLIVGGDDDQVLALNEQAFAQLTCEKELKVIPGATHLFEEPGALEKVSDLAAHWFAVHLGKQSDK